MIVVKVVTLATVVKVVTVVTVVTNKTFFTKKLSLQKNFFHKKLSCDKTQIVTKLKLWEEKKTHKWQNSNTDSSDQKKIFSQQNIFLNFCLHFFLQQQKKKKLNPKLW